MNLTEQQNIVLRYLPMALRRTVSLVDSEFSNELSEMVTSRLTSGAAVFGHRMFTMPSGELREEAIEELADAILYLTAYLYTADHGSLEPGDETLVANA